MSQLDVRDTINGAQAVVQAEIDGKLETLLQAKNVEAYLNKNKESLSIAGSHWEHPKLKSINGTGSMTLYYMSSLFLKKAKQLADKGQDFYFDMIVTLEDKESSIGKQTVVLRNCNMDRILLTKMDVDSAALEEDFDFTFTGFDTLETFKKPKYF